MGIQNIVMQMMQEFTFVEKDQVDQLSKKYLGLVANELDAKRAGLIVFNHKITNMTWLVEWQENSDNESYKGKVKAKRLTPYTWMMNQFEKQTGFFFQPDQWPSEASKEHRMFKKWESESLIVVPVYRNELKGFCFFGKQERNNWTRNDLVALKQVSNLFGLGLEKRG